MGGGGGWDEKKKKKAHKLTHTTAHACRRTCAGYGALKTDTAFVHFYTGSFAFLTSNDTRRGGRAIFFFSVFFFSHASARQKQMFSAG